MDIQPSARRVPAFVAAPRRRQRHTWLARQRTSRRGRFELAVMSGGSVALALSVGLNGLTAPQAIAALVAGGVVMTMVTVVVGMAPAVTAALFAPVVVALSDPMWTLGMTAAAFSLSNESWTTFVVFFIAALVGTILRQFTRRWSHGAGRRRTR